ncbi:MAG TPA: alpha/beta fold hydrolase [Candidatus Thermoplasmatota archaeon]|nr:alpha/beta fold hydrolase [Candidatus Thermoplasmatota archaeon]
MPAPSPAVPLHHTVTGPATGFPIVLLHGFPFDGRMWQGTAKALSEAGYKVVVPDLRGHGKSPVAASARMEEMARDVSALLESLGVRKAVVLGFSMGGYVALQMMARDPEVVRLAVLVDTRAEADTAAGKEGRAELAAKVKETGMQAVVDAMLPKLLHPDTPAKRPGVANLLQEMMLEQPPAGAIAAIQGMAERPDMKGKLRFYQLPALVMVGEGDQVTPMESASSLAQAISYSQYEIVSGAGHAMPLEQPAEFHRILLGWLRKSGVPPS